MRYYNNRVLLLMRGICLYGGGAERRFWRLFVYMRKNKYDVHILLNRDLFECLMMGIKNANYNDIKEFMDGVHVFKDIRGVGKIINIIAFNIYTIKTIRKLRPKVLHLVLIQKSLLPLYIWLIKPKSFKIISTIAFSHIAYNSRVSIGTKLIAWLIQNNADMIDSLYPIYLNVASPKFKNKIMVSPCSFSDGEDFKPAIEKEPIILFAGRLIHEKNPLLLIYALRKLKEKDSNLLSNWKVYILGKGPLESKIIELASCEGLKNIVQIKGVPSVASYMARARIFVSLQRTENYPSQSLLEAMLSGCAVIATNVGHTYRLIDDKTGILIPNDSPEALADALYLLMKNPELANICGNAARAKVLSEHNIEKFAQYIKRIWEC